MECPKNPNGNSIDSTADRDDEYFVLEQSITLLRSALHEEIRQRHRLIADIGSLRKAFAEMSEHHAVETDEFHRKFEDISQQCKVSVFEKKKTVHFRLLEFISINKLVVNLFLYYIAYFRK